VSHDELIRRFIDSGRRAQAAVNFEIAKAELRKLGITLTQWPGEYQVNLTGGPNENALTAETLDEAVQLGIDMARTFPPATPAHIAAKISTRQGFDGQGRPRFGKGHCERPASKCAAGEPRGARSIDSVHCGSNRSSGQRTPTPAPYDAESTTPPRDPRAQSPSEHAGLAPAEANYRRQKIIARALRIFDQ
jgi:hypothetical protein